MFLQSTFENKSENITVQKETTTNATRGTSGNQVVPYGRTDRHDEAYTRFSQFCERAKNLLMSCSLLLQNFHSLLTTCACSPRTKEILPEIYFNTLNCRIFMNVHELTLNKVNLCCACKFSLKKFDGPDPHIFVFRIRCTSISDINISKLLIKQTLLHF